MPNNGVTGAGIKRSLHHFALGKLATSLIGIGLLLLLVRVLDRVDYGVYIVLIALFEILQLGSNAGVFAAVFRYVPNFRVTGSRRQLLRFLGGLLTYRLATLAAVAVLLVIASESVAGWLGLPHHALTFQMFALLVVFEGLARFIDIVFESLLLQGNAQVVQIVRNGGRVMGLAWVLLFAPATVSLSTWIMVEAAISAAGCLLALAMLARYALARDLRVDPQEVGFDAARLVKFAFPMYVAQVLSLFSGLDGAKIFVNRFAGSSEAAAFGFAAALAMMLLRYLPAFLLIGMVRPLFVLAREQGRPTSELVQLSGLLLKLNVLVLAPVAVLFVVSGPSAIALLSAGKLPDSLDYLYFFLAYVFLQCLRAVVSLVGVALEDARGTLLGATLALTGLAIGIAGYPVLGTAAIAIGLLCSETIWIGCLVLALRRHGVRYRLPTGLGRFLLCFALAAVPGLVLVTRTALSASAVFTLLVGVLAGLLFLVLAAIAKPFDEFERGVIGKLVPRRFFVW